MDDIYLTLILLVGLLVLNPEWFSNPFFSDKKSSKRDKSALPNQITTDQRA